MPSVATVPAAARPIGSFNLVYSILIQLDDGRDLLNAQLVCRGFYAQVCRIKRESAQAQPGYQASNTDASQHKLNPFLAPHFRPVGHALGIATSTNAYSRLFMAPKPRKVSDRQQASAGDANCSMFISEPAVTTAQLYISELSDSDLFTAIKIWKHSAYPDPTPFQNITVRNSDGITIEDMHRAVVRHAAGIAYTGPFMITLGDQSPNWTERAVFNDAIDVFVDTWQSADEGAPASANHGKRDLSSGEVSILKRLRRI